MDGRGGRRGSKRLATELRAPAEHGEHAVQSPGPSLRLGGPWPRRPGHRYLPWGRTAPRPGSGNRRRARIPAIARRTLNPRAPGFWVELRSLATREPEKGGGTGRGRDAPPRPEPRPLLGLATPVNFEREQELSQHSSELVSGSLGSKVFALTLRECGGAEGHKAARVGDLLCPLKIYLRPFGTRATGVGFSPCFRELEPPHHWGTPQTPGAGVRLCRKDEVRHASRAEGVPMHL